VDVARSEAAEAELDRLIERREEARRQEENRSDWLAWYRRLERGYLERAAECCQRATALEEMATSERTTA
jgi:hypothetical protein